VTGSRAHVVLAFATALSLTAACSNGVSSANPSQAQSSTAGRRVDVVLTQYAVTPFPATFWLDRRSRIRRVRVDYKTAQGTRITVDALYSSFGVKINVTLPAAGDIADISP